MTKIKAKMSKIKQQNLKKLEKFLQVGVIQIAINSRTVVKISLGWFYLKAKIKIFI